MGEGELRKEIILTSGLLLRFAYFLRSVRCRRTWWLTRVLLMPSFTRFSRLLRLSRCCFCCLFRFLFLQSSAHTPPLALVCQSHNKHSHSHSHTHKHTILLLLLSPPLLALLSLCSQDTTDLFPLNSRNTHTPASHLSPSTAENRDDKQRREGVIERERETSKL